MIDGVAPGWYLACFSRDLARGQARAATIAGEELVVYRTEGGQAVAQERYCPHLGGNLATGKVVGETIRCPFHFWRYDGTGACTEIPRCAKIPPKARLRTYPVVERFEGIWAYVGGATPYYELPAEQELLGDQRCCGGLDDYGEVRTSARDIVENAVDYAHGASVHSAPPFDTFAIRSLEPPSVEAEIAIWVFKTVHLKTKVTSHLYGPGLWVSTMDGGLFQLPGVVAWIATPLTATTAHLRAATWCRGEPWKPWVRALAKLYAKGTTGSAVQDLAIWNHKRVEERPILSGADLGPIMGYRKWYAQLGERARAADAARGAAERLPSVAAEPA